MTPRSLAGGDSKLLERFDALRRGARTRLLKRLYRDVAGGPEHAVLIAGVARSGTTWLAELICSQLSARLMFEPFNPRQVTAYRGFAYTQYMRPGSQNDELLGYVTEVLSGSIRDPRWIDRMVDRLRPDARVVKAVRACLMLRWIHDHFPRTPTLLIVRHPCAVVASFQKLGWSAQPDLESMEQQPELLADHLTDCADLLARAHLPHQKTALLWCINNRVALRQSSGSSIVPIYYESLLHEPERMIPEIFRIIGRTFDETAYRNVRRPSRTAKGGTGASAAAARAPGWAKALTTAQVDDVLETVSAFGLADLYDDRGRPTGALGASAGPSA